MRPLLASSERLSSLFQPLLLLLLVTSQLVLLSNNATLKRTIDELQHTNRCEAPLVSTVPVQVRSHD